MINVFVLNNNFQVNLYSKIIERPKMTSDNTPELVQEVTLEGEKTNNRNYFCRVTIRRRPTDLQNLGELYLEEDTSNSQATATNANTSDKSGKACQFFLGSNLGAQRWVVHINIKCGFICKMIC